MTDREELAARLEERSRTHERGFPVKLLYTNEDQQLDREAAARLRVVEKERDEAREALQPFVHAFEARRDFYSLRHRDRDLGYANFDKMPGHWPMENITFSMDEFRRAVVAQKAQDNG